MPSPNLPAAAPPAVQAARALCLALTLALIALCLLWELHWAPTGRGGLAIKALPLVLALPGLLLHRMYTYRWLSLAVWLYVLEGLVRANSERAPSSTLAWAETVLAVALFAVLTHYIRRRLRDGRALAAAQAAAEDADAAASGSGSASGSAAATAVKTAAI
jgi:uncharacterized membrane protein